jgi:YaiO family outer membrane protein
MPPRTAPRPHSKTPARPPACRGRRGLRGFLVALVVLLVPPGLIQDASAQTPDTSVTSARQRAEQLRREQRLPEALAAYRTVAELDPGSFEDRFWIAKLESWTGRLEAAESDFVRLLDERPDDYDSKIALADVRLWRGRPAEARSILEDLSRTHADDPEVLSRLAAVARAIRETTRWEAGLEYYGERLPGQPATDGATLSLGARAGDRLRWCTAGTLQQKFDRTETRVGGELGARLLGRAELRVSASVAPGAEVLPRQAYGLGVSQTVVRRLVLHADYEYLDFLDANVHQVGPDLEIYAGHWLLAGRYRYSSTRFSPTASAVGNDAGSVSLGYVYGAANLVRIFAASGAESFTQPSRDVIGEFHAHTVGISWRQFITPRLGLEAAYARQHRSSGTDQDAYSFRLVRRW